MKDFARNQLMVGQFIRKANVYKHDKPANIQVVIFSWHMYNKEIVCQLTKANMSDVTDGYSSLAF